MASAHSQDGAERASGPAPATAPGAGLPACSARGRAGPRAAKMADFEDRVSDEEKVGSGRPRPTGPLLPHGPAQPSAAGRREPYSGQGLPVGSSLSPGPFSSSPCFVPTHAAPALRPHCFGADRGAEGTERGEKGSY